MFNMQLIDAVYISLSIIGIKITQNVCSFIVAKKKVLSSKNTLVNFCVLWKMKNEPNKINCLSNYFLDLHIIFFPFSFSFHLKDVSHQKLESTAAFFYFSYLFILNLISCVLWNVLKLNEEKRWKTWAADNTHRLIVWSAQKYVCNLLCDQIFIDLLKNDRFNFTMIKGTVS
jgi:hypothetical protein